MFTHCHIFDVKIYENADMTGKNNNNSIKNRYTDKISSRILHAMVYSIEMQFKSSVAVRFHKNTIVNRSTCVETSFAWLNQKLLDM